GGGDAKSTTTADAGADAHLAGSKRRKKGSRASKDKDQLAADAGAKSALTSSVSPTDPAAAVNGHSKKPRKEKKQTAAAALDVQAGPSKSAKDRETETGAPQATSQPEDAVTTQSVATRTETAALKASAPPVHIAEERIGAAVAPGPELPGERQEGTTGLPSAATNPAGPGTNAIGIQSFKESGAVALQPAAAPVIAEEAGRYFPETGTTPVNAFLPERLPRPEETNAQEKRAIIELQRQLSELQVMYKDLKATKIGQMDKLLAEMAERAEGRVCVAEQLARHWEGVAKRAQEEAIAAGSVETANRIDALEAEANQLLKQNQNLLQRVTQLQLELCHAQQDLHDARAELLQFRTSTVRDLQGNAKDKDKDPDTALPAGATAETEHVKDVNGAPRPVAEAAAQESLPEVTLGGVRSYAITDAAATGGRGDGGRCSMSFGIGLQSEMLSPGAGEQTTKINVQLFPVQGPSVVPGSSSRSVGISTDCQRIVQMLPSIRSPSRSIQSHRGRLSRPSSVAPSFDIDLLGGVPRAGSLSSERGIDTACQRVIQMLPELRQPSPSIEPSGVTPATADGNGASLRVQEGGSKRLSDGSPIDGICGSANRKTTCVSTLADLTHAHNMCAPEALGSTANQQGQYSFVDLNPSPARKASHMGVAASIGGLAAAATMGVTKRGGDQPSGAGERQAGPIQGASLLVTAAAAKGLPPSPGLQQQADYAEDVSPHAIPVAATITHSGSVASNQVSCNISGLVARALAQPQEAQQAVGMQEVGRAPQACGDRSPMLANMALAALPSHAMAVAGVGDPMLQGGNTRELSRGDNNIISSPSPRTAKLNFYERLLEWHVDVISTKPLEAFRMTHMGCGMSFEIRQTEVDDDDLAEDVVDADQPADVHDGNTANDKTKYYEYIPLDLGTVNELLPAFLKETITIPADQRPKLLEKLDRAIKSTRGKKL
ncbi:hypothetical protein VaNZ11_015577, partial [Volvox africanus]